MCLLVDGESTKDDQEMINTVAEWLQRPQHMGRILVTLVGDTHTEARVSPGESEDLVLELDVLRSRCSELVDNRAE